MSGLNIFDLDGVQSDCVAGFPATGANFVAADMGKPVVLVNDSGAGKFGRGSENDPVFGVLKVINSIKKDNNSGSNYADEVTVQNKGFARVPYLTGSAPTVGASVSMSATAGKVKGASVSATLQNIVVEVDSTTETCVIQLK